MIRLSYVVVADEWSVVADLAAALDAQTAAKRDRARGRRRAPDRAPRLSRDGSCRLRFGAHASRGPPRSASALPTGTSWHWARPTSFPPPAGRAPFSRPTTPAPTLVLPYVTNANPAKPPQLGRVPDGLRPVLDPHSAGHTGSDLQRVRTARRPARASGSQRRVRAGASARQRPPRTGRPYRPGAGGRACAPQRRPHGSIGRASGCWRVSCSVARGGKLSDLLAGSHYAAAFPLIAVPARRPCAPDPATRVAPRLRRSRCARMRSLRRRRGDRIRRPAWQRSGRAPHAALRDVQARLRHPRVTMLSISAVLALDSMATGRAAIAALGSQTIAPSMELVLVGPKLEHPGAAADRIAEVTLVDAPIEPFSSARAAGIAASRGRVVFVAETHGYPRPDCLELLSDAIERGAGAAMPRIVNANPATARSWATLFCLLRQLHEQSPSPARGRGASQRRLRAPSADHGRGAPLRSRVRRRPLPGPCRAAFGDAVRAGRGRRSPQCRAVAWRAGRQPDRRAALGGDALAATGRRPGEQPTWSVLLSRRSSCWHGRCGRTDGASWAGVLRVGRRA